MPKAIRTLVARAKGESIGLVEGSQLTSLGWLLSQDEHTASDYYFDSYAHYGELQISLAGSHTTLQNYNFRPHDLSSMIQGAATEPASFMAICPLSCHGSLALQHSI